MSASTKAMRVLAIVAALASAGYANWSESFTDGQFDLATWQFPSFPQVTGTFKQTITPGAEGNHYLTMTETMTSSKGGAAFGAGFGSNEKFKDVRVGATLNVAGDASHNYYGLLARASYFIDPDGKMTGVAPGFVADCYIMHINYTSGPANLSIDLEKVVMNQNIMDEDIEAVAPGVVNARSYYAELDVVGTGPVYVTGSLYEYKGGPLVVQATMVDTDAKDWWEDANKRDKVFLEGISGVFAQNEDDEPVGFTITWDDISSVSDGPAAVALSPANGATGVSTTPTLRWVEGAFATGRQLWFGTPGNMQLVDPAPEGASYTPAMLESGRTYQWRVDQVGPAGVVTGRTWQFTAGQGPVVEDFESYADDAAIGAAWPHNIPGDYLYVFAETATVNQGARSMKLNYQNQYEPFVTEATRTFAAPQDWTIADVDMLSVAFRGLRTNVEQPMYVRIADSAGAEATVSHPANYAVLSEPWRTWEIALADFAGVDLTAVATLTIGVGGGEESSGQGDQDLDTVYLDAIRLGYLPAEQ
jgi:hypothetical protein